MAAMAVVDADVVETWRTLYLYLFLAVTADQRDTSIVAAYRFPQELSPGVVTFEDNNFFHPLEER
jgi:hypothetical protein